MSEIIGKEVVEVRSISDEELEENGWGHEQWSDAVVVVFENGTKMYPSADTEGNGSGCMFGNTPYGDPIRFLDP